MQFSEKQFLAIPFDVIKATHGHPVDALVFGYISGWENSRKRSKVELQTGIIAEFIGVSEDTIGRSIKRLVGKGLIGTKLASHGITFTTRKDVMKSWLVPQNAEPQKRKMRNHASAKCGTTKAKNRSASR